MTVVGVGVDLSLSATGLTIARAGERPYTTEIKTKPVPNAEYGPTHRRIVGIVAELVKAVQAAKQPGDLVIINIEQPAIHAGVGKMVHIRDGLWWMAYHFLAKEGLMVTTGIQHLKQYATGRGNADKAAMILAAERAFPIVGVMTDNHADASWLCAMVMRAVGHPFEVSAQRCYPAFLSKVDWPDAVEHYRSTTP